MFITNNRLLPRPGAIGLTMAVLLTVTGCAEQTMDDLRQYVAATKAAAPGRPLEPLPEVEEYVPFTYTAQGEKDPFAPSEFVQKPEAAELAAIDSGIRPDPSRPREELEKFALGSLKMVGTYRNAIDDGIWALIKAPDGVVHRVQTGNYMGSDHGQIIGISDQRIDLNEIISDGSSGWKERESHLSLSE